MRRSLVSFFLFSLLVSCLVLSVLPLGSAVSDSDTFWGQDYFVSDTGTFGSGMPYGFFIDLFSTLDIPSAWYLQYTMGFYLMDVSDDGYYIGFHQYRGDARVYLAPVSNGVYYGMDGLPNSIPAQYQVGTLNPCDLRIDYNSTTDRFSIVANGVVLANNTFSGLSLTQYRVVNPLGREGIAGNVHLYFAGYDNSDFTYNESMTHGIQFDIYTDAELGGAGGSVAWTSVNAFGIPQDSGTDGFYDVFGLFDSLSLNGSANSGYVFSSHFVSNDFTGAFRPAGYYDRSGRLVVDANFYHLYASEEGQLELHSDFNTGEDDYYWSNSSGVFMLKLVDQDTYAEDSWWDDIMDMTFGSRNPNFAGVIETNPFVYQYSGGNVTLITHFISVNFSPNMVSDERVDFGSGGSGGTGGEGGGLDDDDDGIFDGRDYGDPNFDLSGTINYFMILILMFAPAMTLVALVPKVGLGGFFGVLSITSGLGLVYFGLPPVALILVALGIGVIFFSMFKKV